jgi:5-methyltetrahydrofolate--homocysteine methyltransferase
VPNAGMPQNQGGKAVYKMSPAEIAEELGDFIRRFDRIRIIGGCCGTNPQHIYELRRMLDNHQRKNG